MSSPDSAGWFEVADPVVRAIVRKKLRVSLSDRDDRRENQEAQDLVQDVLAELAEAIVARGDKIGDLKSYAAVVAYHACAQHLRDRFPAHTRLKNKLRYFLNHEPGFAVWETSHGDLWCGYAGWSGTPQAPADRVNALTSDPSPISARLSHTGASNAVKSLDSMKAADWRNLVEGILDDLGGPVELDQLMSVASSIFQVKDEAAEAAVEPSVRPNLVEKMHQQDLMRRLWLILQDFEHRWLMAFLLNLPGATKEARGEIEAFETSGAANRQDIGRLLALIQQEYEDLGHATAQWPADPGSPEDRMSAMWPHLPREDVLIARALRCEKQQVINLRAVAVQKAAKRMKETMAPKN